MTTFTAKKKRVVITRAKQQFKLNLEAAMGRIVPESDNWPKTLAQLTGIGVSSAQRYLNPDKPRYSFVKMDQLLLIAYGLRTTVSELLRDR